MLRLTLSSRTTVLAYSRVIWLAAIVAFGFCGCEGIEANQGQHAWLRVNGGEYFEGPIDCTNNGPEVISVDLSSNTISASKTLAPLKGATQNSATSVAIALEPDRGYWILPTGIADVTAPGYPTFDTNLSFSEELPPGKYQLHICAVNSAGVVGPKQSRDLIAIEPRSQTINAPLYVRLRWDTQADLDLHVQDPLGNEIWKGDISSATGPDDIHGGLLDIDSNAACVIDGRRTEIAQWPKQPMPGHYLVRVDTFSLCEQTFANWTVEVWLKGKVLVRANGESTPQDERYVHQRGAGVLAVEFDVP